MHAQFDGRTHSHIPVAPLVAYQDGIALIRVCIFVLCHLHLPSVDSPHHFVLF